MVIEALAGNGSIALAKSAAARITDRRRYSPKRFTPPWHAGDPSLLYAPGPPDRERRDPRPALPTN